MPRRRRNSWRDLLYSIANQKSASSVEIRDRINVKDPATIHKPLSGLGP
jgi:hypothetical protein